MGYEVYRPKKRRGKRLRRLLLMLLLAVIVAAIASFFICQKYLVYTDDGVRLDPKAARAATNGPAPRPTVSPMVVDVEVEIGKADYSALVTDAGNDLEPLHGRYLTADQITEENLRSAAAQVKAAGGDMLVLQMKPASGQLSWKSSVELADEIDANGTLELADTIADLKENGIRFGAAVSCLADTLLAQADDTYALKSGGEPYTDGSGSWLDPKNDQVKAYTQALCRELAELGFDEIFCSFLQMPATTADLELGEDFTRSDAVMSFGSELRRSLRGTGVKLSVICSTDSIAYDRAEQTGQDLALLPRLFDRLCVFTDAGTLTMLQEKMTAAYENLDTETRIAPFVPAKRDSGSWILTT